MRMWIADKLYWLSRKVGELAEDVDPGYQPFTPSDASLEDLIYDIHPSDTPFRNKDGGVNLQAFKDFESIK